MDEALKSYPARWSGPTLLACRKCQKKLKKAGVLKPLAKLGKTMRKRARKGAAGGEAALHVVDVGCMDLCPKGGVAVCKPGVMGDRLYVVRSVEDVFDV
jgi:predicted metal-binding protein